MSSLDVVRFACAALAGHRLRTLLSMLGVTVGTGAVIVLASLGEGTRAFVTDQFTALGTNLLVVVPGKTETSGGLRALGAAPHDLTIADAEALARDSLYAYRVAPVTMGRELVSYGARSRNVNVVGTTHEMAAVRDLHLRLGSFLPPGEWDRGAPVVVIGHTAWQELFQGGGALGEIVRIGDARMRVIGVLDQRGVSIGLNLDDVAMVPVATAMRAFNRASLSRVLVKLHGPAAPEAARREVADLLARRHQEEDFTVVAQDAVVTSFSAILTALTAALGGIASISLSVAGIGIMNVMLVSVAERTAEIGLLKAVGARPWQVLAAFLTEAVLISLGGGLLGLGAGWAGAVALASAIPDFAAAPPPWALAATMVVAIGVGTAFGLLPARRATRLDPIVALRG